MSATLNLKRSTTDRRDQPGKNAECPLRRRGLSALICLVCFAASASAQIQRDKESWIKAEDLRIHGKYEQAIPYYELFVKSHPVGAYNSLGECFAGLGKLDRARQYWEFAVSQRAASAFDFNNRGRAYKNLKQYPQAITAYDQAIKLDPNDAALYGNRGIVYQSLQQYERAVADYDQAIRLDPNSAAIYRNRGIAFDSLKQYQRAVTEFDQALRIDPAYAAAYYNRGGAYANLKQDQRAIADFDEAIRLDPNNANYYSLRAVVYESLAAGQGANKGALYVAPQGASFYERALSDKLEASRLAPDDAELSNDVAWLLSTCSDDRLRDGAKAFEYASRSCSLTNWQDATLIDTLAAVYAECSDFDHAVEYQLKALEIMKAQAADAETLQQSEDRLRLYREGKPYREKTDNVAMQK